MNWLHYLLEANIYLGVFYVAYCLFLNKETHYLLNRLYLVLSSIVSFILPVLQLGILLPPLPEPPTASYFVAQQVTHVPAPIAVPVQVTAPAFTLQDGLWYAYLAGAAVFAVLLMIKLLSLYKLIGANKVTVRDNYRVVYLKDTNTAFSFFNYLFIGTAANNERTILRHELVHIRQKHSADIIFLEFLKIINWFNPLVYLLQNSLKTQHEYIADEQTVIEEADATSYSSFLVNNAYGLSGPAITHSFYNLNLLRNRIIMLHQQRSGNLARLKYLVAVPIVAALLCASTLGFSKTYGWIDLTPQKPVNNQKQYREAPPTVMEEGPYTNFVRYLSNNLHFPTSLKNKHVGITTLVSFELDKKGLIKNVSTDYKKYDANISNDVVKAIVSYKKPINDKLEGKHFFVLNFSPKGLPLPSINSKLKRDPGYLGTFRITDEPSSKLDIINYPSPRVVADNQVPPKPKQDQVRFPPPIIAPDVPADFKPEKSYVNEKGYKIEEGPFTANGKNYYVAIITEDATGKKIGSYYKGISGRIDTTLKSKYGYVFPDVKVSSFIPPPEPPPAKVKKDVIKFPPPIVKPDVVKFPPPIVKSDKAAPKNRVDMVYTTPVVKPFGNEFMKFLSDYVKYPALAQEKGTKGYVSAEVTINDNTITNSRIIKGIGDGCDEEILRVLNAYKGKMGSKSGTYLISIAFNLVEGNAAYQRLPEIDEAKYGPVISYIYSYGPKK